MARSLRGPFQKTGQPENFCWRNPEVSYPAVSLADTTIITWGTCSFT